MMEWPDLEELKQVLNVDPDGTDWDVTLEPILLSAIRKVKHDVGQWDEYEDLPDDALNRAALRMAELMAQRPDARADRQEAMTLLSQDPAYQAHLFGHRKRFGFG
jgi:hypothetical protein